LDFIRTFPCGESEYCWLSYDIKNEGARALYRSFGFVEQTDVYVEGGEMPAVLKL
jgi:diamine N-acetyltransferase